MAALDLIPPGAQYDNLRGALVWLQRLEAAGYKTNPPYSQLAASRVQGWVDEINSGTGRDADQIRDDIVRVLIPANVAKAAWGITDAQYQLLIQGGNEGGINLSDLPPIRPVAQTPGTPADPTSPLPPSTPAPPSVPTEPPPVVDPTPPPDSEPTLPTPVDYRGQASVLFPYLPSELVGIIAEKWAETGDANLALAYMRASSAYDRYFPGNRRADGSLRYTEAEYASNIDAYRSLYREYGLNPDLFGDQFVSLIVNDQSPAEHARRLNAAYENVLQNIPQMKQVYAEYAGIAMTDQAIFASIINPTIGEAIVNHQISVAAVGAEGLARNFNVGEAFAERLANAGVDQMAARQFFSEAEMKIPTLDQLAQRFRAGGFDLNQFAEASVFGSAPSLRKISRLMAAEAALYTAQLGTIATGQDLTLTGLTPR